MFLIAIRTELNCLRRVRSAFYWDTVAGSLPGLRLGLIRVRRVKAS